MNHQVVVEDSEQPQKTIEAELAALQPLKDLAKNWDIDIASWYVAAKRLLFVDDGIFWFLS